MPLHAWLKRLLEQTTAAFGKMGKLTELEAESHLRAWMDLAKRYGRFRFERALQAAIARSEFFPRVGAIESHIPSAVRLVANMDDQCGSCHGTGWERIFQGRTIGGEGRRGNPIDRKAGAVRRCSCWNKVEAPA
jgi:hypothetical protein